MFLQYARRVSIADHRRHDREPFRRSFEVKEDKDGDTFTGNGNIANGTAARTVADLKAYKEASRHNIIGSERKPKKTKLALVCTVSFCYRTSHLTQSQLNQSEK